MSSDLLTGVVGVVGVDGGVVRLQIKNSTFDKDSVSTILNTLHAPALRTEKHNNISTQWQNYKFTRQNKNIVHKLYNY